VVLMGGVGMLGGDDLALPYPWLMRNNITLRGQWLCPRTANASLIALARAGLLELDRFTVTEFGLDDITEALDHAAGDATRFALTVVRP
jgi:alcohol dehydrogenase